MQSKRSQQSYDPRKNSLWRSCQGSCIRMKENQNITTTTPQKKSVSKRMSYHKLNRYVREKIINELLRHIFFSFLRIRQRPLEEKVVALHSLERNKIRHYGRNIMGNKT